MVTQSSTGKIERKVTFYSSALWLWLSVGAVLLVIAGNMIALTVPSIYADLTPAFLAFLILTGIPILLTPVVQTVLLDETAAWGLVIPIGTMTVILTGLLAWLISTVRIST